MNTVINYTIPKIKIYATTTARMGTCIYEFSPDSEFLSGQNLISYSFNRNLNNDSDFTLRFRENNTVSETKKTSVGNVNGTSAYIQSLKQKNLYDMLQLYQVVEIKENDVLVFLGIITKLSINHSATTGQKIITVSGKNVGYYFNLCQINCDMAIYAGTAINGQEENSKFKAQFSSSKGNQSVKIKDIIDYSYKYFANLVKDNSTISSVAFINAIQFFFGFNKSEISKDSIADAEDISFQFPLATGLVTNGTTNLISFIKNLLPSNVYEVFDEYTKYGYAKLKVREKPFDYDSWEKLNRVQIYPEIIKDYTLTRSSDEVYTAFLSYVEGSSLSSDMYQKANGTTDYDVDWYLTNFSLAEKRELYGYKPLTTKFVGYGKNYTAEKDQNKKDNSLKAQMKALNIRLANWYGRLDEMYSGTVRTVVAEGYEYPKLGEIAKFLKGEFYVTSESHSWSYGQPIEVSIGLERGGIYSPDKQVSKVTIVESYSDGTFDLKTDYVNADKVFHPFSGLSLPYVELNVEDKK